MTDIEFIEHGSIVTMHARTVVGVDWIDEHVLINDDTQFWGRSPVVEPRYARDIVSGARRDGLKVEVS